MLKNSGEPTQTSVREAFLAGGWDEVLNFAGLAPGDSTSHQQLVDELFSECFEPSMVVAIADAVESTSDSFFAAAAVNHFDWQVRVSAVVSGLLPDQLVVSLCDDAHPSVRAAVSRTPLADTNPALAKAISGEDPLVLNLLGADFIESLQNAK